ncbi:MAG: cysteine desulfurase family protein [Bdellovibrionales bacterium]
MEFIYLDHNATTPLSSESHRAILEGLSFFGNPSSIHWAGRKSKNKIREARAQIAQLLNVSPLELIFTSGASEANNTVIKTLFQISSKKHFITSQVEHPSVLKTFEAIERLGARVDYIPVNREGFLNLEIYKKCLSEQTALVSIMYANNETGSLFPIAELARMAHEKGALFHTDAVQALGKIPVDLAELGVDYASFSAHKFYALKGTGVLFAKKGVPQIPLIHGGAQERHRRGGTENVLGILSLGAMASQKARIGHEAERLQGLRDFLQASLLQEIPEVSVTAGLAPRLPNTLSLVLKGVDGETLLMNLDIKGYAVSTGAACSSGNPEPSPVLLALGLTRDEAQNSLRISLGWETTETQVLQFIQDLKASVARLRQIEDEQRRRGENQHVGEA